MISLEFVNIGCFLQGWFMMEGMVLFDAILIASFWLICLYQSAIVNYSRWMNKTDEIDVSVHVIETLLGLSILIGALESVSRIPLLWHVTPVSAIQVTHVSVKFLDELCGLAFISIMICSRLSSKQS